MPTLNSFQTLRWPKRIQRRERATLQYATQLLISIRQGSLGFREQQFILPLSTYILVALQENNAETCIPCRRQMLFPSITGGNQNRQQGQHLSVLATICSGCHYCHNLKYKLNNLLHTVIHSLYCLFIATVFLASPCVFVTTPSITAVPQIFLTTPSYPFRKFQGCPKTLEVTVFPFLLPPSSESSFLTHENCY